MTSMTSFCCFYCCVWTYFTPFPSVSIVEFEHVNVSWVRDKKSYKMKPWHPQIFTVGNFAAIVSG